MSLSLAVVAALARQCAPQVALPTMMALVENESRLDPYAIGDNTTGRSYHPRDAASAIELATTLSGAGHSIDMGLGQINNRTASMLGLDVAGVFDPCRNLAAASQLMVANYRRVAPRAVSEQHAIAAALSMYNTGDAARGFRNGYVGRVWSAAARVGAAAALPPMRLPYELTAVAMTPAPSTSGQRSDRLQTPAPAAPWVAFGNPANVMVFAPAAASGRIE